MAELTPHQRHLTFVIIVASIIVALPIAIYKDIKELIHMVTRKNTKPKSTYKGNKIHIGKGDK